MSTVPFEPHRFKSTAEHYARGRLPYPSALIRRVVWATGLSRQDRVLDLGCGTGFLTRAFADYAGEVVGIDPEPAMLSLAREYTAGAPGRVQLLEGSSFDLSPKYGRFRLVVMGRSFHWTDRAATLARLDDLTARDGAVVLFGDADVTLPTTSWKTEYRQLLDEFSRQDPARLARKDPSWVPHEAFLLDSAFNSLERFSIIVSQQTSVDSLLHRALSMSSTSPEKLASDLPGFVGRLKTILQARARDGALPEVVEFQALIARRSHHRGTHDPFIS